MSMPNDSRELAKWCAGARFPTVIEPYAKAVIDLNKKLEDAEQQLAIARLGLLDAAELIDNSQGVVGLHQNGDIAPWSELRGDGRCCEWLCHFDAAVDSIPDGKDRLIELAFPNLENADG